MSKCWFHKVIQPIPLRANIYIGEDGGMVWYSITVQGGINTRTGEVFINYNYYPKYHPLFWYLHFHEFMHRFFWLLNWERIDDTMESIDKIIAIKQSIKNIRKKENAQKKIL